MRPEHWKQLLAGVVLVAAACWFFRHEIDDWVAGANGRAYCLHQTRCNSRVVLESCVWDAAVRRVSGDPITDECLSCLRSAGCAGARTCTACAPAP